MYDLTLRAELPDATDDDEPRPGRANTQTLVVNPPPVAELRANREILPGQWLQTWHAPWLAAGVKPGQFVQIRTPDASGQVMRRPFSVNTFDRASGEFTLHFRVAGESTSWLSRVRPGETIQVFGPLGRGFDLDPRSRHLLLVAGGIALSALVTLVAARVLPFLPERLDVSAGRADR